MPFPPLRELFQTRHPFWTRYAEALAQRFHFGEQQALLLLDMQGRDQPGELPWLAEPGDLLDLVHLPCQGVGIGPGQLHVGEQGLDLRDLVGQLGEVGRLALGLLARRRLPTQALELT
ncbi:hypothetical protein D3C78_1723910 [compost metagenome]